MVCLSASVSDPSLLQILKGLAVTLKYLTHHAAPCLKYAAPHGPLPAAATWGIAPFYLNHNSWPFMFIWSFLSLLCSTPQLHLMFNCAILCLLSSVTSWNLSCLFVHNSTSLWSQNTLQERQTLGWKFCGYVEVPVLPHEALSESRRWPVQSICPPLLEGFPKVALFDFMDFPLH